jgi:UDP-3-O-[3-hydroxymyristoyl] glucosamine N-acyltransferase
VAPIETAGPGEISFIANPKYARFIETTGASALILSPDTPCERLPVLRHPDPYLTYARVVNLLYPDHTQTAPGVHGDSVIEWDVTIDESSRIGPLCHVRHGSVIGRNCQLVSSVYVGENVEIGDNCLIYPGVRILNGSRIGSNVILHSGVVIGSDGFGFAPSDKGMVKIKQVGWVEIEDDVEIGSNTTVDRGALGPTRIGRGTKIDNLVQIAHNVEIGENAIIISQSGISGSTKIGNRAILAGQVGLVGHIEIGDDVQIGAKSGVAKSVEAGKTIFGYPARDIMLTKRIEAALLRLPELLKRVRKLESDRSDQSGD